MDGQLRWQIICVLSEDRLILPTKTEVNKDKVVTPALVTDTLSDEEITPHQLQGVQTELVYKRGIYLFSDATLRELRNGFVDTQQGEGAGNLHFQFLRSDVPGDRIEVEAEGNIMLSQIEHSLIQKRTIYVEMISAG